MSFTKIEKKHIIVSALVLGFAFAFNDRRAVFELGYWVFNFIKTIILVLISILIFDLAQKHSAKNYGAVVEHKLWSIERYSLKKRNKLPFPIYLGIFLPILISMLSLGRIIFAASKMFVVKTERSLRIGRKFMHLTDYDAAKIAATGPLSLILFGFLLKIISNILNLNFDYFITINFTIAIANMLPLPKLTGGTILFGSKTFYISSLTFMILCVILIKQLSTLPTLILSAVFAFLIAILYFYKVEYSK